MTKDTKDDRPPRILQVSGAAMGGGAEKMAWAIFEGLHREGQTSWMAVNNRNVEHPEIFAIPQKHKNHIWDWLIQYFASIAQRYLGRVKGAGRIRNTFLNMSSPGFFWSWWHGREYFGYPGSRNILNLTPELPDLVHCHNLHGNYFDLRFLAKLSQRVPVVMTLHDEWTMTGHCAYTLGCERWKIGCGSCPGLNIFPRIRKDASAENWQVKKSIYEKSRLYVSTPSQWLMDEVQQSILVPGIAGSKVINNGVDQDVFKPSDRAAARAKLGLPQDALILLFTANHARRNMFKDYDTVRGAAVHLAEHVKDQKLLLIALGDDGKPEFIGDAEFWFVPYEKEQDMVAAYYQAADLYLHAANADNFPTTILEALSCGTPVVATDIGGISEQIESLVNAPGGWQGETVPVSDATGIVVPDHDSAAMGKAAKHLIDHPEIRSILSENAVNLAKQKYDLSLQLSTIMNWYKEILLER